MIDPASRPKSDEDLDAELEQLQLEGVLDVAFDFSDIPPGKRAVIYLRVSTKSQVNTDYDPEGISLPAQRKACYRKAEQLGVTVIDEYVEPGKSATEMTKRVAFQQMLERIRTQRDVDYVIVYKLSRMARNRIDDAIVAADLKKRGVTLISATEAIDETPIGQLMHGILAAFNEFRSAEEGADISYKMGEKAKKGGTLGLAPLGYLNTIERIDGREIRSVALDPERAPLVKLAFEMYAQGDATYKDIAEELEDRGLRTRATPSRTAKPLLPQQVQTMLRNPYYIGVVSHKGDKYEGRHEALIEVELFEEVQELMRSRGHAVERRRVVDHYLKGTLWCARCYRRDQTLSRMIVRRTVGRSGGEYFYYFCRGTQEGYCDAKYINMQRAERAVEDHYRDLRFTPEFVGFVRDSIHETLSDQDSAQLLLKDQIEKQLATLKNREANLIDLAADGTLERDQIRERMNAIAVERSKLSAQLETITEDLGDAVEFIEANLQLLENPYELYLRADDELRRRLNQAVYKHVFISAEEDLEDYELTDPLGDLMTAQDIMFARHYIFDAKKISDVARRSWLKHHAGKRETPANKSRGSFTQELLAAKQDRRSRGLVCSKANMVGLTRFELATP
jgi:DNA invertase Pin-like site-specific DNA recombinase